MRPLGDFPLPERARIRGVFTDIDDTLTTHGRLTAAAFEAMERLHAAGVRVVPITGRPAGWCDHIARMWPVDAVVGENGAFFFRYDRAARQMRRVFHDPQEVRADKRARLERVKEAILAAVPGAAVASDQFARVSDLAIDFCEDVPPLDRDAVERIRDIFLAHGATAKISSIHVNGWFGDYDKLTMTRRLMREAFAVDLDVEGERARYVFAGDSPNDSPMFGFFPHSVGVANVAAQADLCAHLPRWVTAQPFGAGFVELADALLAAR